MAVAGVSRRECRADPANRISLLKIRRDYVNAMAVDEEDDEPDEGRFWRPMDGERRSRLNLQSVKYMNTCLRQLLADWRRHGHDAGRRSMLPENSSGSSAWIRGLFALAIIALLFGIGLQVEGLSRRHQEQIESQEWPAVTASVVGCFLAPYYPFQKNGGGVVYTVQCRFRYSANDAEYESTVESVGYHHSFPHPNQLPEDALQMETWAKRHKKGSPQVIHYNPANPEIISLAGADDQISQKTAAVALKGAKQAFMLGLAFLLLGLVAGTAVRRQKRSFAT